MAASTIRVTPDQMRRSASTVQSHVNDWRTATSRINVLVSEMSTMWDGLANDAFNIAFREDQPNFERLLILMNDYYTAINTAAAKYDAGEQEVGGIVSRR